MATLPSKYDMVANILTVRSRASEDEILSGRKWYTVACTFATGLAKRHGWTVHQAAGVIAALSPRTSWGINQRNAVLFAQTGTAPTLTASLDNARKAREGRLPTGKKTHAFAQNILGNADHVTIDRHALRVAGVETLSVSVKQYDQVADAYRTAAGIVGEPASTLQAITWIVQRGGAS